MSVSTLVQEATLLVSGRRCMNLENLSDAYGLS